MDARVESWDEDGDLQGDLFGQSVSTQHTSLSSRQSVHSESNAGDDDWNLQVAPNDESSKKNAITSATQLGIPIPANVPASALLGGAIRRLGKKKSRPRVDDDWAAELDFSQSSAAGLKLKSTVTSQPSQLLTPPMADQDDMDDWAEGSLGIRFGGTKRENRGRSSSISAMSPSMNSCITLESEDDGLDGLVLPEGPLDLGARLQKRKQADISASEPSESPTMLETRPQESVRQTTEADDLIAGIDFTPEDLLSKRKPTINRYVKINVTREQQPVSRSGTTLTFSDKPTTSRIPRPKPTRLDPVYEAGATVRRFDRLGPTTTSAQLLKAKRSAPLLRNMHVSSPKTSVPHGSASMQGLQSPREPPRYTSHLPRRDSDPTRGQSPTAMRSHSRLSSNMQVDSPTHTTHRRESGPSFAARDSGQKKALGRPSKRRHFGDGSELDIFDDLPTSAVKESKYVRTPLKRPSSRPALRHQQSQSKLSVQDRATTPLPPLPQTPQSSAPSRSDTVPRFAQDTTASRNAREQRLNGTRLRSGGPLMPISTNWKAQVAARSPYSSPSASRVKQKTIKQQPFLVKPLGTPVVKSKCP